MLSESLDKAVTDKSAEKGCREYCAKMLKDAADKAAEEVSSARTAIEEGKRQARGKLDTAKATLAGMQPPEAAAPLPERIGMASWAFDVMLAAFGAIGFNGLACFLLAFAAHHKSEAKPARIIDVTPQPVRMAPIRSRPLDAGPVIALLKERVPEAEGERASWFEILAEYRRLRASRPELPNYSSDEFGRLLKAICEQAEIPTETIGDHIYCVDRKVISSTAPKRLGSMTRKAT
jgi:hypothetical protein